MTNQPNQQPSSEAVEDKAPTISMPDGIKWHNASNEPCDMLFGPCCCGAWHLVRDLPSRIDAATSELRRERDELRQQVEALREALNRVLQSATPNERDNPAMFAAWQEARKAIQQLGGKAGVNAEESTI